MFPKYREDFSKKWDVYIFLKDTVFHQRAFQCDEGISQILQHFPCPPSLLYLHVAKTHSTRCTHLAELTGIMTPPLLI